MTIAACYVSPEGVVLGADSTSSAQISPVPGLTGFHYLNYNQKLFELGRESTLGVLTWGLGGLPGKSYRTLFAELADDLQANPPESVAEVVDRWIDLFWAIYSKQLSGQIARCAELAAKPPAVAQVAEARTEAEEEEFQTLHRGLFVGFCIGGYVLPDRTPTAFHMSFDPLAGKPTGKKIVESFRWWGAPNPIKRLILGSDDDLKQSLLDSGKWQGTEDELAAILAQQQLGHPMLPIREAVDFVHACIYATIKAMKFSNLFQICGGPIEVAVITSDRKFRWVNHKPWDAAITEGYLYD